MRCPEFLSRGDQVYIVSPAKHIPEKFLQDGVRQLESWGLKVKVGRSALKKRGYFAGTDKERAYDFQVALDDPNTKAIICARGGYGTIKILGRLDWTEFRKKPKWIVGFSDLTIMQSFLNSRLKIESIHGPMPYTFNYNTKEAINSLKGLLFGKPFSMAFGPHKLNVKGTAEGELVGGNLSVLCSGLGTPFQVRTANRILFIEEIDEPLYAVDRMLESLKYAGLFAEVNGVLIGKFTDIDDRGFGSKTLDLVKDALKEYRIPIAFNFPSGHVANNKALPLGRKLILEVGGKACKLEQKEP